MASVVSEVLALLVLLPVLVLMLVLVLVLVLVVCIIVVVAVVVEQDTSDQMALLVEAMAPTKLGPISETGGAFAAIRSDGSVVTWRHAGFGGDSSAVQEQLRHVQQIQASHGAFAAIRSDGSVVTWGPADYGGDSSAVQDRLRDV
ncbi:hypothetical protein AK812_SmicGene23079 [Symbiodinium microadriaticum]|uniref:E3 ubiquitin-protein ligase HERC2 n=1 Tax=Symbiodinium microadriaticum TaxID=2951 RepID=A0A1Q9DI59_SYMMI|nr:hypothetical protein AK812_SmicGene23079 [Symbiodinium microadriaticum]